MEQVVQLPLPSVIGWILTLGIFLVAQVVTVWVAFHRYVGKRFDQHASKLETEIHEAKTDFGSRMDRIADQIRGLRHEIIELMKGSAKSEERIDALRERVKTLEGRVGNLERTR